MITDRRFSGGEPGAGIGPAQYFTSEKTSAADLQQIAKWTKVTATQFRDALREVSSAFPLIPESANEDQKHVSFFVHGYNNGWPDSVGRYADIRQKLYDGPAGLGVLVLFAWPSFGNVAGYLPDREEARECASDFADVLVQLHDHLTALSRLAAKSDDEAKFCRAKVSIIAHSMGNYVTEKALAMASKRLNNPQLVTLIHQLVMVAADVDNDLFERDQEPGADGPLMANLCYRIGALYTGLDQVLGASAGLKHFGTRRLGRSGLANPMNVFDNIFDLDVTSIVEGTPGIHSAVFDAPQGPALLREILRGVDRGVIHKAFGL